MVLWTVQHYTRIWLCPMWRLWITFRKNNSETYENWHSLWVCRIFRPFPKIDTIQYTSIIIRNVAFWWFSFKLLPIEKYLLLAEVMCLHQWYYRYNQAKNFHFSLLYLHLSCFDLHCREKFHTHSQENVLSHQVRHQLSRLSSREPSFSNS